MCANQAVSAFLFLFLVSTALLGEDNIPVLAWNMPWYYILYVRSMRRQKRWNLDSQPGL